MTRLRWQSSLGAVVLSAVMSTLPSSYAAVDDQGFVTLLPHEIVWQDNAEGPDFAYIYGHPQQEGFYVVRARFSPGVMSLPHFHPSDRHVTVISGIWWTGKGRDFDPQDTIPLYPGSYMLHPSGEWHFDGAKDVEAIVEIKGIGPAPTLRTEP